MTITFNKEGNLVLGKSYRSHLYPNVLITAINLFIFCNEGFCVT